MKVTSESEANVAGVDGHSGSLKTILLSFVPVVIVEIDRRGRSLEDSAYGSSGSAGCDGFADDSVDDDITGIAVVEVADGGNMRLGRACSNSVFLLLPV